MTLNDIGTLGGLFIGSVGLLLALHNVCEQKKIRGEEKKTSDLKHLREIRRLLVQRSIHELAPEGRGFLAKIVLDDAKCLTHDEHKTVSDLAQELEEIVAKGQSRSSDFDECADRLQSEIDRLL